MGRSAWVAAAGLLLSAAQAPAQNAQGTEAERPKWRESADKAGEIASQPARDVGAVEQKIPPVLLLASADPYSLKAAGSCTQIAIAIGNLNGALGPDYSTSRIATKENRAGKLAEAGGQTVINSLIPFRGLVREMTGAAPAQRRLNAAIDAGYARRGFLRGLYLSRKCRTPI